MNFIERLSCVFGKQYIFKQEKNRYWNRYIDKFQTKEEAQDWLIEEFYELENRDEEGVSNNVHAVYVKCCKEIIYSRHNHDFRSCSCREVSVDGSYNNSDFMIVIFKEPDSYIKIELDSNVLLQSIMYYDWAYKNKNADKWKEGYYGKFQLNDGSNKQFYERLIVKGFNEVWNDVMEGE